MIGDSKTEVTVVLSVSNEILFLVENESVSKVKYGLGYLVLKSIGRFQNLSTTQSCPWNLPCFCPIPWSAEFFGFTACKLELGRPQHVHYNHQSIQVFDYKFCSIGRPQNSRHFNLLGSVNFLAWNQEYGRPENPVVLSLMWSKFQFYSLDILFPLSLFHDQCWFGVYFNLSFQMQLYVSCKLLFSSFVPYLLLMDFQDAEQWLERCSHWVYTQQSLFFAYLMYPEDGCKIEFLVNIIWKKRLNLRTISFQRLVAYAFVHLSAGLSIVLKSCGSVTKTRDLKNN